ncbi:MAG: asparagine synthase-related protein [Candidatus Bathyarchaeia archaeon]
MSGSINEVCFKLQFLLEEAVKRNLAEGILLSGGLDTSVLAATASKFVSLKAFTVALQGAPAPDVEYATLMANNLRLKHFIRYFDKGELYDAIPHVVRILKSFDPMEIRNSVTIYVGLRMAREDGISTIMTGDGCDELLAGYDFLFDLEKEQLDLELQKLWNVMFFSSIPLAKALKIRAKLPYLDPDFKSFAMKLDSRYKIRRERGRIWGKWILRKAFENILPEEVVWRIKTPIEYGSGTTVLPSLFDQNISNGEFEEKRSKYLEDDRVVIRSKEQLFYYELYRSVIGVPHPTDSKRKICPQCNSNVAEKATYCRTCGAYPI